MQKVYASESQSEVKSGIPVIMTKESVKIDTIPVKKTTRANVKIKGKKNIPPPPPPKEMKENELPIPSPPPSARNMTNAEFPEGLIELRKSFANIFDSSEIGKNEKGLMKTKLYITIDETGKTTDIKAEGDNQKFNEESIRTLRIVTENKKWKPAREEGKPAATVFLLPITMNIQ